MSDSRMKTSNIQTERKVLSLLLNNESAIETALSMGLVVDDFSNDRHRHMYSAIVDVYVEQSIAVGEDLDILIPLVDYFDDDDRKQNTAALKKLQKLKLANGKDISMKFINTYVTELKNLSVVREIIRCTQEITKRINDEDTTVDELREAAQKFSEEISLDSSVVRMDMPEAVKSTILEIVEESESDNNIRFFIDELDDKAKILKGYLTYVIGSSGMGKSAVLLNMANRMSDEGARVGYFSLEMTIADCIKRIISIRESIFSQRLQNPKLLKSKDWELIEKVLDSGLKTNNIHWRGKPDMSIAEFEREVTYLVKVHDIDVVLVDYYQLLKMDDGSSFSESIEIPRVSASLRTIAGKSYINPKGKQKKISIVALSQVVKEVERREDKHPYMHDMYYGGAKDARLVVALYRDEYYYPDDTEKPDIIEFGIVKQNNGMMNEWVDAFYNVSTFEIRDLTDDERVASEDDEVSRTYSNKYEEDDDYEAD